ncbi:hypothetical protein M1D93_14855 [Arthrobacter sp. Z1-9]
MQIVGELVVKFGFLADRGHARNTELDRVTLDQLRDGIESFYQRLPELTTDREIRDGIYQVLFPNGSGVWTFPKATLAVEEGQDFFRARPIESVDDVRTTADVREPHPELVRKTGRVNTVSEPILYTSLGNPTTALRECRFEDGTVFAMSRFVARNSFQSTVVGPDPDFPDMSVDEKAKRQLIQGWLRSAFSAAKDDALEPDPYRLSRALALEFWDLPEQGYTGWAFPSVADPSGNGWNVSFRPKVGSKMLRYKQTHVYRLLSLDEESTTPDVELLAAFEAAPLDRLRRVPTGRLENVIPFWPSSVGLGAGA